MYLRLRVGLMTPRAGAPRLVAKGGTAAMEIPESSVEEAAALPFFVLLRV